MPAWATQDYQNSDCFLCDYGLALTQKYNNVLKPTLLVKLWVLLFLWVALAHFEAV